MNKLAIFAIILCLSFGAGAQETFQSFYKQGNKELDAQNYQKALEYFDRALQLGNEDSSRISWTATICGICAIQLKDEIKAIEYNNMAIEYGSTDVTLIDQQLELAIKHKDNKTTNEVLLAGRNIEGYYEKYTMKLLYFYYNNQMYEQTIIAANEVLLYKPGHINSMYFKGVALSQTGDEEGAVRLFTHVLEQNPHNGKVNTQLGLIYYNKASANFDKANLRYRSLKKPTRLDYHNYGQEIQISLSDYKKCIPLFEKAYEAKPQEYIKEAIALAKSRIRQIEQD